MKGFFLDLWADLRAKRLWPVAALLVAGLVAVPVVMLKPADDGSPTPAGVAAAGGGTGAAQPAVTVDDSPLGGDSALRTFRSKDPFAPQGAPAAGAKGGSGGGAPVVGNPASGGSALATGSLGGGLSGGSSASTGGSGAAAAPRSSGGSGSGGSAGGGSATGGAPSGGSAPRTVLYTYTVDLRVGRKGQERIRRGVPRLALLPSDRRPLLVFLGVNVGHDQALFLVDSRLSQAGDGRCRPSADECTFLSLRIGEGHLFTDQDGTEYDLRLLRINRVRASTVAKGARAGAAGVRARGGRAHAAGRRARRSFLLSPFLVDELR